jgi:Flp pilus assembly pilin Flp
MIDRMLNVLSSLVARACREQDGQALVEYSLLILLVAVAAIAVVQVFGLGVSSLFQSVVDAYP